MSEKKHIKAISEIQHIKLTDIKPNPNQPRKYFDKDGLEVLKLSIEKTGLLQPVLVRKDEEGQIFLISGERRFRTMEKLKSETIPAVFVEGNSAEIAIIENLAREDLCLLDEAEALAALKDEHGYTDKKIGAIIEKARSTVTEIISINKLQSRIKDVIRGNKDYALRVLKSISGIENKEDQWKAFETYQKRVEAAGKRKGKHKELAKVDGQELKGREKIIHNRIVTFKKTFSKFDDWRSENDKQSAAKELTQLREYIDGLLAKIVIKKSEPVVPEENKPEENTVQQG